MVVLDPFLRIIGDLVVVPTGILVTLPWAVLPACAGRPVTVAPSATTWSIGRTRLRAVVMASASFPALLVAGPDNERGEPEVRAIAAMRPNATVLTGPAATPTATLAGMDGVAIVHLAAHGHHESENPLFSSLELAGGQIMGYDLQRVGRAPSTVVLSSCDLGLSAVRPGDETLGMVTALLSVGTSTVVASVSRVADQTAMNVMTSYHGRSAAAAPPRSPWRRPGLTSPWASSALAQANPSAPARRRPLARERCMRPRAIDAVDSEPCPLLEPTKRLIRNRTPDPIHR